MAHPTRHASTAGAGRAAAGADVVRHLTRIAGALRQAIDEDVTALGLTPAAARALAALDPDRPMPARHLADELACDRSNVTALVDRLEEAGLVRRAPDPTDRRLKTLVVTDAGRRVRADVHRVMADSRLLAGLTDGELTTLRDLLPKVSGGAAPID
ncbi:MarR family winged helix-turn-helix transcriptional regulator [Plantactinospora sp. GCM10030261]|uniref:MarR family winged helix-turn-helix transcriptional regulator n=1 Tax=Plantactinospora sp. GCM10030261 TaxID=3273420 RepID=UPI003607AE58